MITLVEADSYKSLKRIRQPLRPLQVLVGPNGSGKTSFLEVVGFLGRLVNEGMDAAISERGGNLYDIVWGRPNTDKPAMLQLAVEAEIPENRRRQIRGRTYDTIRYEVILDLERPEDEAGIATEAVVFKPSEHGSAPKPLTEIRPARRNLLFSTQDELLGRGCDYAVMNVGGHSVGFTPETTAKRQDITYRLSKNRSALGSLPDDETQFPATSWLKQLLAAGIRRIELNGELLRRPSPPGLGRHGFSPDGASLPWQVERLKKDYPDHFDRWVAHVRTALPQLKTIRTVLRDEDRHRYLMLCHENGVEVPSWGASDGTLRLLALTILAYLPDLEGIFLIEEPENGINPRNLEVAYQSLSSIYDAQVLLATHSPVLVSMSEPEDLLCFSQDSEGATQIVSGDKHPHLKDWKHEISLGALFAAGVLD